MTSVSQPALLSLFFLALTPIVREKTYRQINLAAAWTHAVIVERFWKCDCFSPLQVFISDEVFHLHLRDLVVVQAQLCDGGRKV